MNRDLIQNDPVVPLFALSDRSARERQSFDGTFVQIRRDIHMEKSLWQGGTQIQGCLRRPSRAPGAPWYRAAGIGDSVSEPIRPVLSA
jgi:hypothetical protein